MELLCFRFWSSAKLQFVIILLEKISVLKFYSTLEYNFEVIVLHFRMQGRDINDHINSKCHMCAF